MTGAEIVVAEAGVFLLASEALAAYVVLRVSERARQAAGEAVRAAREALEALEGNWVKGGVKLEVTSPDGRLIKPPAEKKAPAAVAPAEPPVPISDGRRSA
jgi:thiazole synthase ThiGH ThiG subunit